MKTKTRTNYFEGCQTIEDLKKEYKRLAMLWHPDVKGGNLEVMQEVNAEYDLLFPILKNVHAKKDGTTYQATGNWETSETVNQYKDIISALIKMQGVKVELCGSWLWITGETKTYKEQLKYIGCLWSANKSAWYYNGSDRKTKRAHCKNMDEVRSKWGSQTIYRDQEQETRKPVYAIG